MPTSYYRILLPEEWLPEPSAVDSTPADFAPQLPPQSPSAGFDLPYGRASEGPLYPNVPPPEPRLPWGASVAMQPNPATLRTPAEQPPGGGTNGLRPVYRAATPESSPSEALYPATKADIEEIIDRKLSTLKVYVLESEITQAQQAVKSVVELASF